MHTSKLLSTIFAIGLIAGCASGSVIVTGQERPAIEPSQVQIYLEPPQDYEVIGIVESSSDVEFSTQAAQDRTVEELKAQAASIGANGVLITATGERSGESIGMVSGGIFIADDTETKVAKGPAIFVPKP